jgi:hypothetical protein
MARPQSYVTGGLCETGVWSVNARGATAGSQVRCCGVIRATCLASTSTVQQWLAWVLGREDWGAGAITAHRDVATVA